MQITMRKGSALPDRGFDWLDDQGAVIDFSTGWTFQLLVAASDDGTALVTITSGITGAATLPNLIVSFTAGWDAALTAETLYVCQLTATSGSRKRGFPDFTLWLTPAITP